jgi:nuclear pore complex protein Nup133
MKRLEDSANMLADTEPTLRIVSPKNLQDVLGSGATHGELCVRFASEDLREPIIKDNVLDDDVLRELLEKNRLEEWFAAANRAGYRAYQAEKQQQINEINQNGVKAGGDHEAATPEAPIDAPAFAKVAEQDGDVDMQDS